MRSVDKSGVFGSDYVQEALKKVSDREAANLMRSTVQAVASRIARETRKLAPKDTGAMRKGIKAKRRKAPKFQPVSEVLSSKFYWRYVDKGHRSKDGRFVPGTNFSSRAMDSIRPRIPAIGEQEFTKRYEKVLKKRLQKARK